MTTSNNNHKHLSLSKRIQIEKSLDEGKNFTQIAELISKANRTISYEVRKHRVFHKGLSIHHKVNFKCDKLSKPPYVCNGCEKRKGCRKDRYFYEAELAHMGYREKLSVSRQGIDMTSEEFKRLNRIVTENIKKGHSFYMICKNHKEDFSVKERTLYNYVELGYLDIINLDLPKKVRYKKRKKHNQHMTKDTVHRIGRTYKDFLKYTEMYPHLEVVEMDTVEGVKGNSVLLTLLFRMYNFMLAFKMESNDSENVTKVFQDIKSALGYELFRRYFPIILTDNGSEFSKPYFIEHNGEEVKETKLFYCDAKASQQKAQIENNHRYIRRYIPKGVDFDNYSQEDIDLMISHINSIPREKYKGQTPYELKTFFADDKLIDTFKIIKINHEDIILNEELFKQKDNTNK